MGAKEDDHSNAAEEDSEEDSEPETAPAAKDDDAELEAAIAGIRANKELPRPPYPTLPNMNSSASMCVKVFDMPAASNAWKRGAPRRSPFAFETGKRSAVVHREAFLQLHGCQLL